MGQLRAFFLSLEYLENYSSYLKSFFCIVPSEILAFRINFCFLEMIILNASKKRLKKTFQGYRSYPTQGATSVPPTLTGRKKFLRWSSALLEVPNESLVNKLSVGERT